MQGLKDVDSVTQNQEGPLDVSRMDMGMTIEVENDQYIGAVLLENTTVPIITHEKEIMKNIYQECLAREFDLVFEVESFRRGAKEWSEDLRERLERKGRPGAAFRTQDHKGAYRRKSGPSDLRYSKLKAGREEDLRYFIKPRRRTDSESPLRRTQNEANPLESQESRAEERRRIIEQLKSSMIGVQERNEEETETSESSDSGEDDEGKTSKDGLKEEKYSKSDTQTSNTISGPPE